MVAVQLFSVKHSLPSNMAKRQSARSLHDSDWLGPECTSGSLCEAPVRGGQLPRVFFQMSNLGGSYLSVLLVL